MPKIAHAARCGIAENGQGRAPRFRQLQFGHLAIHSATNGDVSRLVACMAGGNGLGERSLDKVVRSLARVTRQFPRQVCPCVVTHKVDSRISLIPTGIRSRFDSRARKDGNTRQQVGAFLVTKFGRFRISNGETRNSTKRSPSAGYGASATNRRRHRVRDKE